MYLLRYTNHKNANPQQGLGRKDVWQMVKTFLVIGAGIWFLSQGDLSEFEAALMEGLGEADGAAGAGAAGAAANGTAQALADAVVAPRPPALEDALDEFLAV